MGFIFAMPSAKALSMAVRSATVLSVISCGRWIDGTVEKSGAEWVTSYPATRKDCLSLVCCLFIGHSGQELLRQRFHPRQCVTVLHNQLCDVTTMLGDPRRVGIHLPQEIFLFPQDLAGVPLAPCDKAKADDGDYNIESDNSDEEWFHATDVAQV